MKSKQSKTKARSPRRLHGVVSYAARKNVKRIKDAIGNLQCFDESNMTWFGQDVVKRTRNGLNEILDRLQRK